MKKWHLFLFITVLFIASFAVLNMKYDKFYRVSGINNENRALIETYLDEDEQDYLIENRIPINKFIKYIKYNNFHLNYYEYYNLLDDTGRISDTSTLIDTVNALIEKLRSSSTSRVKQRAELLIDNDLESGYLNVDTFHDNYINVYNAIRPLYNDDSYVDDCNNYIESLEERGLNFNDIVSFMNDAGRDYTKISLKKLMSKASNMKIQLISHPSSIDTVLEDNGYIGSYEPKNLSLLTDVRRVTFDMYLQNDAYKALLKLKDDIDVDDTLVVREAYISYEELTTMTGVNAGYDERQLGRTVTFTSSSLGYQLFNGSSLSKWLEENAYQYGYVKRYDNDEHIYKYIGEEKAKELHDSNKSYEESLKEN